MCTPSIKTAIYTSINMKQDVGMFFCKNYIVYYVIIFICSLKSMCVPRFTSIGCCISELHTSQSNVWPEIVVVLQELQCLQ